jgi:hypothetical protein
MTRSRIPSVVSGIRSTIFFKSGTEIALYCSGATPSSRRRPAMNFFISQALVGESKCICTSAWLIQSGGGRGAKAALLVLGPLDGI